MAQPKKGRSLHKLNQAYAEEFREALGGFLGEGFIKLLPVSWIQVLVGIMPERLLFDSDARVRFSGLLIPLVQQLADVDNTTRNSVQEFLVQSVEEIGKRSAELDPDDIDKSRGIMRDALARKKGLLDSLKSKGGKIQSQKKTAPDYFTAKAAVPDESTRRKLTDIEQRLPDREYFLQRGGFRVRTTPDELIEIADSSQGPDHEYGVSRLVGLMKGMRGDGSIKAKVSNFAEELLDDMLEGDDIDDAAQRLSERLDDAIDRSRMRRTRLKRGI